MKKIFSVLLAAALAAGTMVLPTAAADGDIVYLQTFDDVASYDDLGWEIVETLTTNTSTYTVENGALTVDNLGGNDSYTVVVPASVMDEVNKGDYTVGYDFTLLESGDTARYLAMLLNYDREIGNTYNSLHMRMKGYADWQNRFVGTWSTNMDLNGGYKDLPVFTAKDDGAISNRLFGLAYDETQNVIAGKTIRYEMRVSNTDGYCEIYMNGVLISGTDEAGWDQFTWASEDYSEICLKSGGSILGTVDNIVVVKGLGIPEGTIPAMGDGASASAPAAEAAPAAFTIYTEYPEMTGTELVYATGDMDMLSGYDAKGGIGVDLFNLASGGNAYCLKRDTSAWYDFEVSEKTDVTFYVGYIARDGSDRGLDYAVDDPNGENRIFMDLAESAEQQWVSATFTVEPGKHTFYLYAPTGMDDSTLKSCDVYTIELYGTPAAAAAEEAPVVEEAPAAETPVEEPAEVLVEEEPAEEPVEEEVVEAPAAAEVVEEAPQTFDFGVIAAISAIVSLAGFAVTKKR